jgi:hypothetical protein
MNTSRKRSENTPGYRASSRASASDEFGLGDIDDADLLVVAEQAENDDYADIDDLDGSFLRRAVHAKDPITNKSNDASEQNWTPTRLPNDKFACNHRCKDRDRCKHQCCREGLDKPPKGPPKWLLKSGKKEELTSNRSSTRSGEKKQTRLTSGGRLKGSSTQSQASGTAEIDLTNEPTGLNKVDSATSHDWSLPHLNPTLNHGPQGKSYRFSRSLGQTLGSTEGGLLSFLPSSTHFNQGYESACEKAPSPELYPAQKENTDSPAHYSSDILKGSRTAREKDDYAYSDVSEAALELNHMGTGFDDTPIQIPRAENDDNPAYNIGSDEDLDDLIDWNPRAPSVSLMNPETSTVEAVSAENFHTDYEMGTRHHLALESLYSAPTSKRRAAGAEGASPFIPDPSATASSPSDLIRAESTSPFWKKVKHRHHGSRTANGVEGTNNAIRPQSPTPAVPQNGIEHAKLHAPSLWETPTGDEEGLLLQEFGSCVDFV